MLDLDQATKRIEELSRGFGTPLDPRARVEDLAVGQQQMVEILKLLYRGADILILDEPTAVLVPQEIEELFDNLRRLREQGKTIIFIAHSLEEVLEIADRITVLRDGKVVGTVDAADTTKEQVAELMVGRPVLLRRVEGKATPGEPLLQVKGRSSWSGARSGCATSTCSCGTRRSTAWPGWRATARSSWSRRWSACAAPTGAASTSTTTT